MKFTLAAYLAFVGLAAGMGVAASLAAFPSAAVKYEREPEDLWLLVFWVALGSTVLCYSISGVLRAVKGGSATIGSPEYVVSVIVMVLGAIITAAAIVTSMDRMLIVPGVLVLLAPVAYIKLGKISDAA